jgi:hypothetical protein
MGGGSHYWLTRLVFTRTLALVYLIAFLCALNQFRPLLGQHGLQPVPDYISRVPFRASPSLFYVLPKDWAFAGFAWAGIALSCVAISGIADRQAIWWSSLVWGLIWVLYLSFVNVGQTFYGFGWESILLEAGFFAMFLGPSRAEPPILAILAIRWLEFRIMFGAGLIKMRGDPCWHGLTCLNYHYETQPMPNPLSWYLHRSPAWTHTAGVAFNHFSELVVPFAYFLPQPVASIAGVLTIVFQAFIMASGNLSWLNFLTMVLAIPLIDDRLIDDVRLAALIHVHVPELAAPGMTSRVLVYAMAAIVIALSVRPVLNMMSPDQTMNASYNPLHLVGTYGAFGGITRVREEVIVEGTADAAISATSQWREYEFKGKPGATGRMPPQIAPYHLRLDWLMWFAAMSDYSQNPWFVNFVGKLLQGDKAILGLLRTNPFPDKPPNYIRARLYEYHFTTADERRRTGQWWTRSLTEEYFPAVSLSDPAFRGFLKQNGWL